jgi:hypothetical protein
VSLAGNLALYDRLRAVLPRDARLYPGGTIVTPAILASGGEPEKLESAEQPGRRWPAGVELRRWAQNGDFLIAAALQFGSPGEAGRYMHDLGTRACAGGGTVFRPTSPPGARLLVSHPFKRYTTYALDLVRGAVFYRIIDDHRGRPRRFLSSAEQGAVLTIVETLACRLPATACPPSRS